MKRKYTVYMHISPSNKRYIGITGMNPSKRWGNGKGYYQNIYFTNAINKYGWDNFQHIIIAKGLSKDEAEWLEIELIREFDTTNRNKGYNISFGGDSIGKHSKESIDKMSKAKKGKYAGENNPNYGNGEKIKGELNGFYGQHHTEKTKRKMRKNVICLTTLRIFNGIEVAAEFYNMKGGSHISNCCKGWKMEKGKKKKVKSAGKLPDGTKLVWRYLVWEHNKKYRIKNTK